MSDLQSAESSPLRSNWLIMVIRGEATTGVCYDRFRKRALNMFSPLRRWIIS